VTPADPHQAIKAVFRAESARLVAGLTRFARDVGLAEELAQDALVAALEQWPRSGVPDNPGAWLMAAAKNRAVNAWRHRKLAARKHAELAADAGGEAAAGGAEMADLEDRLDDEVGDDLLRLVFISCHPVLSLESRVALTLRVLAGLTTEEIARAFLVSEPTIGQRIVRAKRTLAEARVPFEVPRGPELAERVNGVLGVVYLVFNEGFAATAGDDLMRPELCQQALRLGRMLADLLPGEPEVHGLVALMELHASRAATRVDAAGDQVLLLDQDRTRWDAAQIARGLAALERAESLGGAQGWYALQAAISACHARARTAEETDWRRIAGLYQVLCRVAPSPIVELNRAMAVAMADGPAAGLALIDALAGEPALAGYHLLPSARGELLARLGRRDEARAELERAAALTRNTRERDQLLARAAACTAREPR
jgi:RNA polymerase sigma-70 factor, ECF subfamily